MKMKSGKVSVLRSICAVGMMAFAATAAKSEVEIDGFKYELDTEAKTAALTGYTGVPTKVLVDAVDYQGQKYIVSEVGQTALVNCRLTLVSLPNATTIGETAFAGCKVLSQISLPNAKTIGARAFYGCEMLSLVSLPNATTVGDEVFFDCGSLTLASLPNAKSIGQMSFMNCGKLEVVVLSFGLLANPDREGWWLRDAARLVAPFTNDEVKNATHKVAALAGEALIGGENYEKGCAYYGLTPKVEPQVVGSDEIAVKKESIQAPSAGTVKVEDNKVQLGVAVLKTSDLTAEKKNWNKVKISKDDIDVDADGNIIVNVPVDSASGFMVIQTKDAKVGQ